MIKMAEKVKRPPFFTLKRWQSTKESGLKTLLTPMTPTSSQPQDSPPQFRTNTPSSPRKVNFELKPRK